MLPATLLALLCAGSASASAEVQARSGYDSNIFYESVTELRDPTLRPGAADGYAALYPHLVGALSWSHDQLRASYDGAFVQYFSKEHGYLVAHQLVVSNDLRLGRFALGAYLLGTDYGISAFNSDYFDQGGGGLGPQVALGPVVLGLAGEVLLRRFPNRVIPPDGVQSDQELSAVLQARLLTGPVSASLQARGSTIGSNVAALDEQALAARADVSAELGRLRPELIGSLRRVWLANLPSDSGLGRADTQLLGQAQLGLRLGAFEPALYASYEAGLSNYSPAAFQRVAAGLALTARWEASTSPAPAVQPAPQAPGRYHFEFELEGARAVSLVGSFNGWKRPGIPLRPDGPGRWVADLPLPPGRYRYQLLVDGQRITPPNAEALAPDGVGGFDGVVEVGGESVSDVLR